MPATTTPLRWRALLALSLAAFAGLLAYLAWQVRPIPMHDLHLADGEKLQCVSYAPFRLPGQTPFDPTLRIPHEQIADDLAALSRITRCVRLYSVDQGLDAVPAVARELGLKVLLGAWIGIDPKRNAVELDRAIALANEYADVVDALIVGNEVLLRRERTPAEMRELLAYAKQRAQVPVTYADVWEFWMRNRELAAEVDLVTVHILPFWEDHPVGVDTALEHVGEVFNEVRAAFDKPVMIGETGWPSAGRQRQESRPSRVNQARYVREFIHHAHQQGWRYNLIEAVDQPWKRRLEGTVGGFWGMLDPTLAPKFPLAGPVAERNDLRTPLLGGLAGLLLCVVLASRARHTTRARRAAAGAMGLVGGIVAVLHAEHALLAYRDALEWSVLGAVAVLGAALPLLLSCWNGEGRLPCVAHAWQAVRRRISLPAPLVLLGLVRGVLLFACAVAALLLAVDPRYRDFPIWLYLLPALYLGLLGWLAAEHGNEERLCSLVIVAAVLLRWLPEPANPQAIAWLLVGLAFGLPALLARKRE
nr:beta-1,6-glucan synthase [Pseudothauera nasutitermitis]